MVKMKRIMNRARAKTKQTTRSDAASYDEFKEFEGRKYTGMRIGRSHYWNYDPGQWKETKITPDLWQISYAVTKRRKGRAPEGSGVPVGTAYHWYIAAHQNVTKLNANDYSTAMTGLKFKVAHKRADAEKWSATPGTQRKRTISFLRQLIDDLEQTSSEAEAPAQASVKAPATDAPAKKPSVRRARSKLPPSATTKRRRKRSTRAKA
jgi:hypothetical protein